MKCISIHIVVFALLVFIGCSTTPSTEPDNKAVSDISFETALNPDGSITMFKINNISFRIMPFTDTRPTSFVIKPIWPIEEFDKMIAKYEANIQNSSANFDDYLMLIALYYNRGKTGDIEQAIRYCDMALNIRKDYPQALYARGLCYLNIGESTKALNDLQAVLKMNIQTSIGVYYVMGMIYFIEQNTSASINAFEQVRKLDPDFVDTPEILEVLYSMR